MSQPIASSSECPGLVWIDGPYPVVNLGLARVLETEFRVYVGGERPPGVPEVVVLGGGGVEGPLEGVKRVRGEYGDALILAFGLHLDLAAAQDALRAGTRGFIHAGMSPDQIVRAVRVAIEGEIVAPRQLLEYLVYRGEDEDLNPLSARQQKILDLVGDGLTNDQIAKKLSVSESTVKQHLRAAYKALGVKNRNEAARIVRRKAG